MDATRSARARTAGGVAIASAIAGDRHGRLGAGRAAPIADWAVLVYMDADTNLEDATLGNLEEILDVGGSTPRVRVMALVDRSTKGGEEGEEDSGYTNRAVANLPDWSGAKLLEPLDGELRELADWGADEHGRPGRPPPLHRGGHEGSPRPGGTCSSSATTAPAGRASASTTRPTATA